VPIAEKLEPSSQKNGRLEGHRNSRAPMAPWHGLCPALGAYDDNGPRGRRVGADVFVRSTYVVHHPLSRRAPPIVGLSKLEALVQRTI
jgi:hypothetical protein